VLPCAFSRERCAVSVAMIQNISRDDREEMTENISKDNRKEMIENISVRRSRGAMCVAAFICCISLHV